MDKNYIIQEMCIHLQYDNKDKCIDIINKKYPFVKKEYHKRSYTKTEMTKVFIRDGFIDRYSGKKLVFPPVLRILSKTFPVEFPFHPNWKMDECHIAYWELIPTIDHIDPIAQGGGNVEENFVCTSMLNNAAKSNFTLEELGWRLLPPGNINEWDGQINWFIEYVDKNKELLEDNYIKDWYRAAERCLKDT